MTNRQILVMDNSSDLIEMIRDALVIYGFDAQLVQAGEDGIHSVKSLRPDVVFIGAEHSDKSRLALCSKAKKVAGSQIPVILVSSSIPKNELDLHGKQRYHADAYLSKWDLASGEFVEKISSLINLKPDEQNDTQPDFDALAAESAHRRSVDAQDGASKASSQIASGGQTAEDSPDDPAKEPGWLSELYTKIVNDETDDGGKNTPPAANAAQHALPGETYPEDDREQRLHEQEKEIAFLQAQLEEARREARSSPFSSDYLNLREDAVQKERELVRLADRLEKYRRRALAGEERLKDLAKRLFDTKAELEQRQAQQKEIELRNETIQNELTRLYGAFEESRKHHDTRIDEIKSEHATAIEKLEQAHKETVESLQVQLNQKKADARAEAESALKDEIEQHKRDYVELNSRLKKVQREYDERASRQKKEHADEIAEIKSFYEKERQELEARIEALRAEHQDEIAKLKTSKKEERQELEARIEALRAGHQDEIDNLKAAKKEDRHELEAKIEDLQSGHQAALESLKEEHQKALSALESRIKEEKAEASTQTDSEWQKKVARKQRAHDDAIAELRKKHAQEMAQMQSAFDGAQEQLDNEIAALLTDHQAAFEKQKKEHQTIVAELKKQIAEQKADSGKAKQDDIANKLTKEHAQEIGKLNKKLTEAQAKYKSRLNELKKEHLRELKKKEKRHIAQIEALKKKLEEQKTKEKDEDKSDSQHDEPNAKTEEEYIQEIRDLKKQIEEMEERHKKEMHENDLQHAADIAKIREELGN